MKINGFSFFLAFFLGVVVLTSLYEPLRYLKYVLPFIPLAIFGSKQTNYFERWSLNYYLTFLAFYLAVIVYLFLKEIFFFGLSPRFFPNAVFILSPLLFIFLSIPFFDETKKRQYVMTIFIISIIVFLYEDTGDLIKVISNFGILKDALFNSTVITESHLGYTFGFFVLFFFMEGYSKWLKILAVFFLIFSFKRVVLGGVIISLLIYFLISIFRIDFAKRRTFWTLIGVSANFFFIKVTQLIVAGTFDDFVFEKTGLSTDRFLMGRKQFYAEAFDKIGSINWWGIGVGKIDDIIIQFYGVDSGLSMRLHSEILKNYFEFGAVVFTIWLFLLYYKTLFSNKSAIFLIYFNILCLTDNAFIYFDVLFYFYFFILIFLHEKYKSVEPTNELKLSYE